jgi:hypothetical protein
MSISYRLRVRLMPVSVIVLLSLAACDTSAITFNFSPPAITATTHKLDADLRSITVSTGRPDERTGDICPCIVVPNAIQVWRTALEEAVTRAAVFDDDSRRRVSIQVTILKIEPSVTGTFAAVEAGYEVIDRANGRPLFAQHVASSGNMPFGSSSGSARLIESINRAVQNNILAFLTNLEIVGLQPEVGRPKAWAPPHDDSTGIVSTKRA